MSGIRFAISDDATVSIFHFDNRRIYAHVGDDRAMKETDSPQTDIGNASIGIRLP